jgi:hypothetical protein
MHTDAPGIQDAGVVAFLRYMMTPAEQRWPRFRPVLLSASDVSMGELRVHPDLIDQLVALDPPDGRHRLRMFMGAAVLVAESGVIYALAYSQRFLAVRLGAHEDHALLASTALDATDRHQPAERIASLGEGWVVAEPWRVASLASLRTVVANARDAARRKELVPRPGP